MGQENEQQFHGTVAQRCKGAEPTEGVLGVDALLSADGVNQRLMGHVGGVEQNGQHQQNGNILDRQGKEKDRCRRNDDERQKKHPTFPLGAVGEACPYHLADDGNHRADASDQADGFFGCKGQRRNVNGEKIVDKALHAPRQEKQRRKYGRGFFILHGFPPGKLVCCNRR